ncbi:hypothetical protein SAMN04488009_2270 [Maribacter sedimenticola]|uniref:DKNYY family protein n=1 Tax=Maribacter sedimenticola TaxID=228956 RepID=A0ABY1SHK3_9FLAO|nr:hypothetical protein [Maribacter sedimenticola]SNR54267.1 hypothetical protein SAMN04488009_2270 [Maribacter sedimenticola]
MKKIFLIFLVALFVGCKTETNKIKQESENSIVRKDTTIEKETPNYFQYEEYKVGHVNDGYGKRFYIDSLHYNAVVRYYPSDSTKFWFKHYDDFVNDTTLLKEYYKNGNLKFIKKKTYHNFIPIGVWEFYKRNGELKETLDFDNKYYVSFQKAITIAKVNGIKKPFETQISGDSTCWKIIHWRNVKFDSLSNRGLDVGSGIEINRFNGHADKFQTERRRVR